MLNIKLVPSLPVTKQGNNNISIVCIPNPPLESSSKSDSKKPVCMLIRVKTSEMADELLSKITESKGNVEDQKNSPKKKNSKAKKSPAKEEPSSK